MDQTRELRAVGEIREVREADDRGIRFVGYAAKFGKVTDIAGCFEEMIAPGAFKRAVAEDDVRMLLNHNPDHVLGRTRAGTLALKEDETGLWFECAAPDTQLAKDLAQSVKRGDINQCSFGFYVRKEQWQEREGMKPLRTLMDLRLDDVSIVTYPAYEDTEASARSVRDKAAAERAGKAEAERKIKLDLLKKKLQILEIEEV